MGKFQQLAFLFLHYLSLKLKELGYRRINFLSHRYFMLYRIENDTVYVDNIFHELQDCENKMN
jgi:plasmid stabilization system protein ParE